MPVSQKILFFVDYFSMGLFTPVLSLVALSHGATLKTLSLFVGLFAVTVIILEVPSGMFADLEGRKRTYLMAKIFLVFSYFTALLSQNALPLAISYVLRGIGISFSSGSLEALIVEDYMKLHGEEAVHEVNRQMLMLSGIGAATGAILGGILGSIGKNYSTLLIVIMGIELLLMVGTILFIRESQITSQKQGFAGSVTNQINLMKQAFTGSKAVMTVLWIAASMGCVIAVVEIYWQQTYISLTDGNMVWMLGIINCFGHLGAIIGSKISSHLLDKKQDENYENRLYRLFRFLLPIAILLLGLNKKWYLFVFLYALVYVITGMGELCEKSILHKNVANEYRASMLSLYSLFIRGGGIISSVFTAIILANGTLLYVWILLPMMAIAFMTFLHLFFMI